MVTNPKGYMKDYFAKNGKKNYKKYIWTPDAIEAIGMRKKARKKMWLKVWDPREVDHKNWNPRDNSPKNLRVISRTKNRKLWWASKKRTDGKLES